MTRFARVGTVGEDTADERERPARCAQQGHGAVPIQDIRLVDLPLEDKSFEIDRRVALAPFGLPARVAAVRTPWSASRPKLRSWRFGRRALPPRG